MSQLNRTLFEISEDLVALDSLLDEVGGEVTDEQAEAAIEKWFAELGEERDKKIDGYCSLIKQKEAVAKARKAEADRIEALATVDKNAASRLKGRLKLFFEAHDIEKLETDRFKVAIQNNGGALPVILTEDATEHPEELPEQYRRVVFQPNLENIKKDLERVADLKQFLAMAPDDNDPGTVREFNNLKDSLSTIATLGERGNHLKIR